MTLEIEFMPGQAMTGRLRMDVMVIVPALTKGQQRYPEIVLEAAGRNRCLPHIWAAGFTSQIERRSCV